MKSVEMPIWAGVLLVPLTAYILNNFVLVAVPYLETLPDLGLLPYFTTGSGILGVWFAVRGNEDNAINCEELCVMFGLAGTMVGLTSYLTSAQSNATDIHGLLYVFITGFHGIIMAAPIKFICLWKVDGENGST